MSKVPLIIAQIVTFNSASTIVPCIQSLLKQNNLQVHVYDNASTDNTIALVEEHFSTAVRIQRNTSNLGFAAAHNRAFRTSLSYGAHYVALINPDLALAPDCLIKLIGALEKDRAAGAACPKLLRADNLLQPLFPHTIDSTGIYVTPDMRHFDRGAGEFDVGQYDVPTYVFGGSGACLLLRSTCLLDAALPDPLYAISEELEFFDRVFFAYREDADAAWRMQWLGWKTLYVPDAVGYHVRKVTPERRKDLPPEINRWGVRNRYLLQLNGLSSSAPLRLILRTTFRNILVLLAVLIQERSSVPAFVETIQAFPRALRRRKELFRRHRSSTTEVFSWFQNLPTTKPIPSTNTGKPIESVAVVIINYRTASDVDKCVTKILSSIPATISSTGPKVEITVLDNTPLGSDGEVCDVPDGVRLLRFPENLGFAGAVNTLLFEAQHDALLILNPDIRITAAQISQLTESLQQHSNLAAIAPVLIDETNSPQLGFTARRFPTLGSIVAELFFLHRLWPTNPWTSALLYSADRLLIQYLLGEPPLPAGPVFPLSLPYVVDQPPAACLLLRSLAAQRLGGFDPNFYPAWFEDVDFCKRVYDSGEKIAVLGSCRVNHQGGATKQKISIQSFSQTWNTNLRRYVAKHLSRKERFVFSCILPIALLLRSCSYAFFSALLNFQHDRERKELARQAAKSYFRLAWQSILPLSRSNDNSDTCKLLNDLCPGGERISSHLTGTSGKKFV